MSVASGGSGPPASSVPPTPRTLRGSRTLKKADLESDAYSSSAIRANKENRLRYADGLQKLTILSVSYMPISVCIAKYSLFPRRRSKLCSSKDLKLFIVVLIPFVMTAS